MHGIHEDVLREDKPQIVDGNIGTIGHLSISTAGSLAAHVLKGESKYGSHNFTPMAPYASEASFFCDAPPC